MSSTMSGGGIRIAATLGLACVFSTCTGREPSGPAFEANDSSGVRIVVSHFALGFEAPWELSKEPILRIGKGRDEEPYLFGTLGGAARLSDGSVVVIDRQTLEIRRFGPNGDHLLTFGGRGEGPGEFKSPRPSIQRLGDTLLILDSDNTLARFDSEGHLLEELPNHGFLAGDGGVPGEWRRVLPDGAFMGARYPRYSEPAMGELFRNPLLFVVSDTARTEVFELGHYPGQASRRTEWGQGYFPLFMTWDAANRNPIGVLVGDTETFSIDLFDTAGRLVRRIRYPAGLREPTPEMMAELKEGLLSQYEALEEMGRGLRNFRRWIDEMPAPAVWPAFSSILGDEEGYTWAFEYLPTDFLQSQWVERPNRPSSALVFHPDGHLMGQVEIPFGVSPVEIGRDYFLGIEIDDLGVNEVVLFGLTRN